ncbi:MAG: SRPBCC family protein [Myxococcota bacterium]|nr:SRPBCC family protein [Myxococcota bacterium]
MEFTLETTINLPRATVLEIHYCWDNLSHWWPDFIHADHISGEDGAAGATYRCMANFEGTPRQYMVTILENDLPDAFHQVTQFEHIQLQQTMRTTFRILTGGATQWQVRHQLTGDDVPHIQEPKFREIMREQMASFKAFAENTRGKPNPK